LRLSNIVMLKLPEGKDNIMTYRLSDHFTDFGLLVMNGSADPSAAISTFPVEWVGKYFANGFDKIDPVFHFAVAAGNRSKSTLLNATQMASDLFDEARIYNADSNVVATSYLGGSKMVFGGVNSDLDTRVLPDVQKTCDAAHREILMGRFDTLTDAQIDVLEMVDEGHGDKEIAAEFGVTINAIAQRKAAICNNIGCDRFNSIAGLYSVYKWGGIVPMGLPERNFG